MHNLLNPLIALSFLGMIFAADQVLVTPSRTAWRVLYGIAALWLLIVVLLAILGVQ